MVVIADTTTLTAKTTLTLESYSGHIAPVGALTLTAGDGIVLLTNITSLANGQPLVLNADYESFGDGTLSVVQGRTVDTKKGSMLVTAWDVDLAGSLLVGDSTTLSYLSVHGSQALQTIGIGTVDPAENFTRPTNYSNYTVPTYKNLHITDAELSRITAVAGMQLGSSTSGHLFVNGVTDGSSDKIGTLTMMATAPDMLVFFNETASYFNKGIVVQAMGGVLMNASATTFNDAVVISAGTGTVTVSSPSSLSTTNQLLTITSDDFDVYADISSGTATTIIECKTPGRTVGLGAGSGQMSITASEFGNFTATGMSIGGAVCGSQIVDGIQTTHSEKVTATLSLISIRDDSHTTFSGNPSTFNSLSIQADNGVIVLADFSTVVGHMYLDGDADDSTTEDGYGPGFNTLKYAPGRSVKVTDYASLSSGC